MGYTEEDRKSYQKWDEARKEAKENTIEQFKAGDKVDGRYSCWGAGVWAGEELVYCGAKTTSGKHICEYPDGDIEAFDEIRKLDPERKYREKAKEMMEELGVGDLGTYTPIEILSGDIEKMLIEALKTNL
jgi:hypothetical protein